MICVVSDGRYHGRRSGGLAETSNVIWRELAQTAKMKQRTLLPLGSTRVLACRFRRLAETSFSAKFAMARAPSPAPEAGALPGIFAIKRKVVSIAACFFRILNAHLAVSGMIGRGCKIS